MGPPSYPLENINVLAYYKGMILSTIYLLNKLSKLYDWARCHSHDEEITILFIYAVHS